MKLNKDFDITVLISLISLYHILIQNDLEKNLVKHTLIMTMLKDL
jgi:hypothetical protein